MKYKLVLPTFWPVENQAKVSDWLDDPQAVVHLFTDDPAYRLSYRDKFQEGLETGKLQFGPETPSDGMSESGMGADDWNHECFKRETDLKTSVAHFLTMALCDYHIATKGSTVHDLVNLLNKNMGSASTEMR